MCVRLPRLARGGWICMTLLVINVHVSSAVVAHRHHSASLACTLCLVFGEVRTLVRLLRTMHVRLRVSQQAVVVVLYLPATLLLL